MTMIPAQNLSKQHRYGGYGGGCGGSYSESFGLMSRLEGYECCLGSDIVVDRMAEDESRTESVNEAGSSSKDVQDERDEGWLQLGIGDHIASQEIKLDQVDPTMGRGGLVELDLLPGGSSQQVRSLTPVFHVPEFRGPRPVSHITSANSYSASLFLQNPGTSSTFPHHQEINWAFRAMPQNIRVASSSSSLMPPGSYFTRPFQLHAGVDVAGPNLDFKVIDPPRRPHSGIWFMLQASQNQ